MRQCRGGSLGSRISFSIRLRHHRACRGQIDDRPAVRILPHIFGRFPGCKKDTAGICIQYLVPSIDRQLIESGRMRIGNTCIVDQYVDGAVAVRRVGYQRYNILFPADVTGHKFGVPACCCDLLCGCLA
ncbi:hypothetical protein D3C80_1814980 [compost metagenome]